MTRPKLENILAARGAPRGTARTREFHRLRRDREVVEHHGVHLRTEESRAEGNASAARARRSTRERATEESTSCLWVVASPNGKIAKGRAPRFDSSARPRRRGRRSRRPRARSSRSSRTRAAPRAPARSRTRLCRASCPFVPSKCRQKNRRTQISARHARGRRRASDAVAVALDAGIGACRCRGVRRRLRGSTNRRARAWSARETVRCAAAGRESRVRTWRDP